MIFLDSWVWLAYLVSGDTDEAAEAAIERANTPAEGGLIAPTVFTDVSYRVRIVADEATATETVRAMREYEHIDSAPLIDEVADEAVTLRDTDPTPASANSRTRTRSISQRPSGTTSATRSTPAIPISMESTKSRRSCCDADDAIVSAQRRAVGRGHTYGPGVQHIGRPKRGLDAKPSMAFERVGSAITSLTVMERSITDSWRPLCRRYRSYVRSSRSHAPLMSSGGALSRWTVVRERPRQRRLGGSVEHKLTGLHAMDSNRRDK